MQIARAYLLVGDPEIATRSWQPVMEEIVKLKMNDTKRRWLVAIKDRALMGLGYPSALIHEGFGQA